jgi:hypothetical protein
MKIEFQTYAEKGFRKIHLIEQMAQATAYSAEFHTT